MFRALYACTLRIASHPGSLLAVAGGLLKDRVLPEAAQLMGSDNELLVLLFASLLTVLLFMGVLVAVDVPEPKLHVSWSFPAFSAGDD